MKENKSIDGLAFKNNKKTPEVGIDGIAPKKKSGEKPAEVKKIEIEEVLDGDFDINNDSKSTSSDFLSPVGTLDFDSESGKLVESDVPFKKSEVKKDLKKEKKLEKKNKKALKKGKKSKVKTTIVTIILFIIVVILGFGCWACLWGNDLIAKITGGNGNIIDAIGVLMSDTYVPLKTDKNGRTNILIFGTSGYNMSGDQGDGQEYDGSQLTDSIMVASVNQESGTIALVNVPRDLKGARTCTSTGKINEVYWCNNLNSDNENGGATALISAISTVTDLDIQYYAHVNWGSLLKIVNTLGGITVTLDEDVYDFDHEGTNALAGVPITLTGNQALALARARYGTTLGDFSRGNSQQKILIGIKDKIYEKNLSFSDMLGLINALGDNLRTNFSLDEIKTMVHLTFEFDFENIKQIPLIDYSQNIKLLSTATINNISYVVPAAGVGNYSAIQKHIANVLKEIEIVPEEEVVIPEEKTTNTTE